MKRFAAPTFVVLALLLGLLIGYSVTQNVAQAQSRRWNNYFSSSNSKTEEVLNYLSRGYVDEIDVDSLTDEVLMEFVQKLDPHSAYIPKKDIELVNSQLSGSFSGIGVQFSIQNDTICVVAVISGGPSEGTGLLAGDKIVSVDDTAFVGKEVTNERVMHKLRGEKGTKVKIGVRRLGCKDELSYTITRGEVPVKAVDAAFIIEQNGKKVGLVKVNKFDETTYEEFITSLAKLRQEGASAYIVDLRGNSGGYMEQSVQMANEFLGEGDLIVYAEGRNYSRYENRANGKGRFQKEKLVVLIDEYSASASEIFAGAMQDNDRATIIGRRSFGKGLVQQQYELSDGSALRMTVARYYMPSGRCIQSKYELGEIDKYNKDFYERFEKEAFSKDSIQWKDSTIYYTKKGRVVYGGGGIMPDIFVGVDTTENSPWFNQVCNMAYTYQFAFQYTDNNRSKLNTLKSWTLMEIFLQKDDVVGQFVRFAESKGIKTNQADLQKSRNILQRILIAYIVRDAMGDEAFYPLWERDDEATTQAVDYLTK